MCFCILAVQCIASLVFLFCQAEDGIQYLVRSRGLGDVYKRQAMVTPRIVPGAISVPQGAWVDFDSKGVDRGGAANVLTSLHTPPLAKGNGQHTALVPVSYTHLTLQTSELV